MERFDYNFYIHYVQETSGNSKVVPKPPKPIVPPTPKPTPTSPNVIYSSTTSATPKIATYIAIAYGAYKITDKALTLVGELASGYGGNYTLQHNWSNFKTTLSSLMNPMALIDKSIQSEMSRYQETSRKEQERLLTGNDFLKGS